VLKNITIKTIKDFIKDEISIYRSLDYKNRDIKYFKEKIYHSYQIGIMLRFIQLDIVFISTKENIFPEFVLKYSFDQLYEEVVQIANRYHNEVAKDYLDTTLMKEFVWTPFDATILLYYLTIYHNEDNLTNLQS
jgi:hypothetical protein